ncbi:hypothetical protein [Argonema galeatum]|uniref:hypothetical protein n=1 Tax=Argonema galeatum TaxID=2942762 RepID=UPI002011F00B|nr:hypothetical protein [Argonema galeatum]MCL1464574.1 hypothetical protein [Argonema galeatum A003/A1]
MTTPTEIRQKAIELVKKLPKEMLFEAVGLLESLRAKAERVRNPEPHNSEESALLEIIQHRLPPQDRLRLDYLRDRAETGEINEVEHSELLSYVERIENKDVERLAALIELAKIKNVDLNTLLDELTSQETISSVI